MGNILETLHQLVRLLGIDFIRYPPSFPVDFDAKMRETIEKVQPYTMTSRERLFALCQAVRYLSKHQIPGAMVECGVWRGGSMMAVIDTLLDLQDESRDLYLFDTFEGMSEPTEKDIDFRGGIATKLLKNRPKKEEDLLWCYAPLDKVKDTISQFNYNPNKIHFVKGKVEETIPHFAPEKIALLRLDTDWYESTRHELIHLFPRMVQGGVIIIDDYGYWQGQRQAVDEYFQEHNISILLNRIDFTGRIGVILKGE